MNCDLGEATKNLENEQSGSPDELSEELVTQEQQKKGWRMNCDVQSSDQKVYSCVQKEWAADKL